MKDSQSKQVKNKDEINDKACGIIMPIASHSDYPRDHWTEVFEIIKEAISETQFKPRLVSADDAIGLIHDRIVTNIYNDEIVICDVSSKNPNVMFELGLRLAFDKPTIIIKDEKTGYSFDTGGIEHLEYPSSLRFNLIVDFKQELIKRVNATYKRSNEESNYSPFLKSFGKNIIPAKIHQTDIPEGKFILEELMSMRSDIRGMQQNQMNMNKGMVIRSRSNDNNKLIIDVIESTLRKKNKKFSNGIIDSRDSIILIQNELLKHGVTIPKNELVEFMAEYSEEYGKYYGA
ncbi:hypothetical protein L3073_16740 [Ancylomarina sp. DW003]|nr:hypothetical protein [Ancylomarina sp. DW003]MDE5423864.1 hypothetical protein [Ancylomarina sp. DW003]